MVLIQLHAKHLTEIPPPSTICFRLDICGNESGGGEVGAQAFKPTETAMGQGVKFPMFMENNEFSKNPGNLISENGQLSPSWIGTMLA